MGSFPHAEYAAAHVISLPMHPYITEAQQIEVANVVREAVSAR
jgi:UDP-2-acetamido-2-deoxy-ribo-hexuluronate aminotransferase